METRSCRLRLSSTSTTSLSEISGTRSDHRTAGEIGYLLGIGCDGRSGIERGDLGSAAAVALPTHRRPRGNGENQAYRIAKADAASRRAGYRRRATRRCHRYRQCRPAAILDVGWIVVVIGQVER